MIKPITKVTKSESIVQKIPAYNSSRIIERESKALSNNFQFNRYTRTKTTDVTRRLSIETIILDEKDGLALLKNITGLTSERLYFKGAFNAEFMKMVQLTVCEVKWMNTFLKELIESATVRLPLYKLPSISFLTVNNIVEKYLNKSGYNNNKYILFMSIIIFRILDHLGLAAYGDTKTISAMEFKIPDTTEALKELIVSLQMDSVIEIIIEGNEIQKIKKDIYRFSLHGLADIFLKCFNEIAKNFRSYLDPTNEITLLLNLITQKFYEGIPEEDNALRMLLDNPVIESFARCYNFIKCIENMNPKEIYEREFKGKTRETNFSLTNSLLEKLHKILSQRMKLISSVQPHTIMSDTNSIIMYNPFRDMKIAAAMCSISTDKVDKSVSFVTRANSTWASKVSEVFHDAYTTAQNQLKMFQQQARLLPRNSKIFLSYAHMSNDWISNYYACKFAKPVLACGVDAIKTNPIILVKKEKEFKNFLNEWIEEQKVDKVKSMTPDKMGNLISSEAEPELINSYLTIDGVLGDVNFFYISDEALARGLPSDRLLSKFDYTILRSYDTKFKIKYEIFDEGETYVTDNPLEALIRQKVNVDGNGFLFHERIQTEPSYIENGAANYDKVSFDRCFDVTDFSSYEVSIEYRQQIVNTLIPTYYDLGANNGYSYYFVRSVAYTIIRTLLHDSNILSSFLRWQDIDFETSNVDLKDIKIAEVTYKGNKVEAHKLSLIDRHFESVINRDKTTPDEVNRYLLEKYHNINRLEEEFTEKFYQVNNLLPFTLEKVNNHLNILFEGNAKTWDYEMRIILNQIENRDFLYKLFQFDIPKYEVYRKLKEVKLLNKSQEDELRII